MSLTNFQQEYLMNCNHRWNVKTGATGSGKTFVDYSVTIPQRLMALKGEGLAVMLGNTRSTLERNILEPMREIWSPDLVGNIRSDNTVYIFGKKVYALGADNMKHVSKIQGATMEYVYGDEVTTWNQEVFEMLKSRLRCEHSCFDGTCNPAGPKHWFKQFLDSDADIFQQAYTIDDGCLPEKVVTELKKEYAGTVRYGRYIKGLWIAAEGLVHDGFDENIHVLKELPETEGPYYVSSDFGIQNATVFLLWQKIKDQNAYVCLDEYYYSGRESAKQKTVSQLVDGLKQMLDGRIPKLIIVDPSAAALITELRQQGFRVKDADNEVIAGLNDVDTMLAAGRLYFMEKCVHTIEEFGLYVWDPKAADKGIDAPIKENDHCQDAVRYFVKTMKFVKRKERVYDHKSIYED